MASDFYGQYMGSIRNLLTSTLEPIERVASLPVQLHKWYTEGLQDSASLQNQLIQLNTENTLLKAQLQRMESLEQELERHRRLLGTTGRMDNPNLQIASVLFYSNTPISQYLTLNKGALDGVQINQPVIDDKGLIGQVTILTPTSSRVLKITDANHQVPVRLLRTGQRGVLTGLGQKYLALDFIPTNANIQLGDMIVTSGLGGIFPTGYPVANVSSFTLTEGQNFLSITAEPIADLYNAHEVLILSRPRALR
jgi:rod shape-determining protein MreC